MAIPTQTKSNHHVGTVVEDIKMGMRAEDFVHVAFMFENLYSDPISAVVREYSTNAFDSHVFAGNSDPIRITLPTAANMAFTVQDFGVGMSLDTLREVYSMYGASDKRETNAVAGQLGMGSKSGLSYAVGFTVTAVKDHETVSAFVTKDEHGLGVIKILAPPAATDEPNGVKISIPVESRDVHRFADAAHELFQFWEPGTVLIDGEAPDLPNWRVNSLRLDDDTFLIRQDQGLYSSYVIMGNVPYPVRDAQVGRVTHRFVARLNIGDVDFAPSREDVRYTPHTNETLSDLSQYVAATYKRAIAASLGAAATRWDETVLKSLWMDRSRQISTSAERPMWFFTPANYYNKAKSHFRYSIANIAQPSLIVITGFPSKTLSNPTRDRLVDFASDKGITSPNFLVLPDSIQGIIALEGRPNTYTWDDVVGATVVAPTVKAKVKRVKVETLYTILGGSPMTAPDLAQVTDKVLYLEPSEHAGYGSMGATVVRLYSTAQLARIKRYVPSIEPYAVEVDRQMKAAAKAVTLNDRNFQTARTLPAVLQGLNPDLLSDTELADYIRLLKAPQSPTLAAAAKFGVEVKATTNLANTYNKRYPLIDNGGYYGNSFSRPGQTEDLILYLNAKFDTTQAALIKAVAS